MSVEQDSDGIWRVWPANRSRQGPDTKWFQTEAEAKKAAASTSNYVVFDPKIINIIKKYGLAGLIAGGAAHYSSSPVDHDPFAEGQQ